ncbi:MAG: TIM barrel protein [Clostridia bacterium]|nr:TIM barrel protein [Clostridia bacterium]
MQNKPNYATFGPGGNSQSFYDAGLKSTKQAPAWLKTVGLDAYEYEAGNGISAGETALREIGEAAREHGILMSLHTPYFISLSGVDPEKRLKSIDYIAKSLWAAELLGADTIVIHCGSAGKISRAEGMALSADTLYKTLEKLGDTDISFGIETMGKQNQLGTLDEVIELCKMDARLAPVVDFGHLNARDCGGVFVRADDYRRVFDRIGEVLGDDKARWLHCHFSKIEWTDKGEKRHLTFADSTYGPDFEPLMEAIARENLCPRIICESAGTMAEDALAMKNYYKNLI